jgi:Leucine-rich repeat (LRR) protein
LADLPDSLGNLSNLTTLNISFNDFTTSPHFTNMATSLQTLDLSNNDIHVLDSSLFSLGNLTNLSLGNNPLITISDRI